MKATRPLCNRSAVCIATARVHFVILALLGLLFGITAAHGDDPVVLAVHPYLPDAELLKRYTPFAEYLDKEIGRRMVVGIGKDYQDHIDSVGKGTVDIAYMGPASYVLLVEQYGKKNLLARLQHQGGASFHGKIFARKDNPVKSLTDCRGRRFAFGDPNSTMSTLLPQFMLQESGVKLSGLKDFAYLGSHDNVALGVLVGDFDAGGVKEEVYHNYKDRGLQVIATTPPIPEHVFVARDDLPLEIIQKIKKALFKLNESEQGRKILQEIKGKTAEIAPAQDKEYEALRHIMQSLHNYSSK